mmetsp:Transcript_4603/g.8059  ORF Transcript_4603/g.8059 Transcript_4603/m.8059 type:complete len:2725 (+) Transcript_4603:140-8314(+)
MFRNKMENEKIIDALGGLAGGDCLMGELDSLSWNKESSCQDKEMEFINELEVFVNRAETRESSSAIWGKENCYFDLISSSLKAIKEQVVWYGTFGAAISLPDDGSGFLLPVVIGLDGWNTRIKRSSSEESYVSTAVSISHRVVSLEHGLVSVEHKEEVVSLLSKLIEEAASKREKKVYGYQKTPGWLASILKCSLEKVILAPNQSEEFKGDFTGVQGGFTDVGRHKNVVARACSWSLVRAVLYEYIKRGTFHDTDKASIILEKLFFMVNLWYVSRTLELLNRAPTVQLEVKVKAALSHIAQSPVLNFAGSPDVDLTGHIERCVSILQLVQTRLDNISCSRLCENEIEPDKAEDGFFDPVIHHFSWTNAMCTTGRRTSAKHSDIPVLKDVFTTNEMLVWVRSCKSSINATSAQTSYCLAMVEGFFWEKVSNFKRVHENRELKDMQNIAQEYLNMSHKVQMGLGGELLFFPRKVDMKSRDVLVSWALACIVHSSVSSRYPTLASYFSIPLQSKSLSYLNLSACDELKALKEIFKYIQESEDKGTRVFGGKRDMRNTLQLVKRLLQDSKLFNDQTLGARTRAKKDLDIKLSDHWNTILERKRTCTTASQNLKRVVQADYSCYASYISEFNRQTEYLRLAESNYPQPIKVPISPKSTSEEQDIVISLLNLPPSFVILVQVLFKAEVVFSSVQQSCDGQPLGVCVEGIQVLHRDGLVATMVRHVPGFTQKSAYENIKAPIESSLVLLPKGCLDPFVETVDDLKCCERFTEHVVAQKDILKDLNQFVQLPLKRQASDRSNRPIAKPVLDVGWIKEEYQALCNLRAFPLSQFPNLCIAIRDDLFNQDSVVTRVVRQFLYHVGEIELGAVFKWRKHIGQAELGVLYEVLHEKLDIVRESPARLEVLLLFGTVSGYFGQWDQQLRSIAREFATVAENWGKELDEQIKIQTIDGTIGDTLAQLRAKQYKCLCVSTLCHSHGVLARADASQLVRLVVQVKHYALHASRVLKKAEFASLQSATGQVMGRLCRSIVKLLVPEAIDEALKPILGAQLPPHLEWSWDSAGYCVANHDQQDLFELDLVTGVVLLNSFPVQRLPGTILNNQYYQELFEKEEFEVAPPLNHCFRALHAQQGYLYSFQLGHLNGKESVQICETMSSDPEYKLIHNPIDAERSMIPPRLLSLHSCWKDERTGSLIFRPHKFKDRKVKFIRFGSKLFVVPDYVQEIDWRKIDLQRLNYLQTGTSRTFRQLSNFEDPRFIHIEKTSEGAMFYRLPRFQLGFIQRNGELASSCDWKGFDLLRDQNPSTLWGLRKRLVLGSARSKLLLCPSGIVERGEGGQIYIRSKNNDKPDASISFHKFTFHPTLSCLSTHSQYDNLQLISLYAATCININDCLEGIPGPLVALEHSRKIGFVGVLSSNELSALKNAMDLAVYACPALWLLLENAFKQFSYLGGIADLANEYPRGKVTFLPEMMRSLYVDARDLKIQGRVHRSLLMQHEEEEIFGETQQLFVPRKTRTSAKGDMVVSITAAISETYMWLECSQRCLARQLELRSNQHFEFPSDEVSDTLLNDVVFELQGSIKCFNELMCPTLKQSVSGLAQDLLRQACELRCKLEEKLKHLFLKDGGSSSRQLEELCGFTHNSLWRSYLRLSCEPPSEILYYNSELQKNECEELVRGFRCWMELCTFVAKLKRLEIMEEKADIIKELQCVRRFDIHSKPEWLVFEVENDLLIRPEQVQVAEQLIDSTENIVTQLRVGLGKTRVILPMLALYFVCRDPMGHLVRLHIPRSIYGETTRVLNQTISGSVLRPFCFHLPFTRDSAVDRESLARMNRWFHNWGKRAVLCTTVEWRLSMELKVDELQLGGAPELLVSGFKRLVYPRNVLNVFDECDMLLDPSFRLTYAVGDQIACPDLAVRSLALQTLLCILQTSNWELDILLRLDQNMDKPGSFDGFQILPNASTEDLRAFESKLGTAVLKNPPKELLWIRTAHAGLQKDFLAVILEGSCNVQSVLDQNNWLSIKGLLYAFRGLLAGGVFVATLQKRCNVDYGIPRGKFQRDGGQRILAVPFRACRIPKDRSDFVHPDCLLLYTNLAFLIDGLNKYELIQALDCLLSLGLSLKRKEFGRWLTLAHPDCPVQKIEQIDLDNMAQRGKLFDHFAHNLATINFFCRLVLFPAQTGQYSQQISRTGWDLVQGGRSIGFSGTNETSTLLPTSIRQVPCADKSIAGANGEMFMWLMERCIPSNILLLKDAKWETLFEFVFQEQASALVDCGAHLVDVSCGTIAKWLIHQQKFCFKGVSYFNRDRWVVLELNGRELPLGRSPIQASETFALYDQGRSRGADLRLEPSAKAVITLGPTTNLSELKQGVGRLRRLANGQTFCYAASESVYSAIRAISDIDCCDSKAVILWAIKNTNKQLCIGFRQWTHQGLLFHKSQQSTEGPCVETVDLELETLYSQSLGYAELVSAVAWPKEPLAPEKEIYERVERIGKGLVVPTVNTSVECERQVEQEREQEAEQEFCIETKVPRKETDILVQFNSTTDWEDLNDVCSRHISLFSFVHWDSLKNTTMRVTTNFFRTVEDTKDYSNYLRIMNYLLFRENSIILLSDREGEHIRDALRSNLLVEENVALVNWSYLRDSVVNGVVPPSGKIPFSEGSADCNLLGADAIEALKIFAADPDIVSVNVVETLLPTVSCRTSERLVNLLGARSNAPSFWESGLHDCCRILNAPTTPDLAEPDIE